MENVQPGLSRCWVMWSSLGAPAAMRILCTAHAPTTASAGIRSSPCLLSNCALGGVGSAAVAAGVGEADEVL
jgi:hypothetical protein